MCNGGYYGLGCSLKCVGYCKDNEFCYYINGICYKGCNDGWIGEKCDIGW